MRSDRFLELYIDPTARDEARSRLEEMLDKAYQDGFDNGEADHICEKVLIAD